MTTLYNNVLTAINNLDDEQLLIIHNDFCDKHHYDDTIYTNDSENIDAIFSSPYDALQAIENYNYTDYYFYLHNGNLVSLNYLSIDDSSPVDSSALAQYVIDDDLISNYDLVVLTIDDMLASIEDNITDDELLLLILVKYLECDADTEEEIKANGGYSDYNEYLIESCLDEISDYSYNDLSVIINLLMIG